MVQLVGGCCDVPTQGYLILSVRGERLSCSVWLWQIKEAVQILARSLPRLLLLSGPGFSSLSLARS